jgi:hypothetical protein
MEADALKMDEAMIEGFDRSDKEEGENNRTHLIARLDLVFHFIQARLNTTGGMQANP